MSFLINPYAFLAAGGDFEPIATVTVGSGGASSIEFTSIPGTYQHLQVRMIARSDRDTTGTDAFFLRLNSDSSTNYSYHRLIGNGATTAANGWTSAAQAFVGAVPRLINLDNVFSATVLDVLDYASTAKNTTIRSMTGNDFNYTSSIAGYIGLHSAAWLSTSAVTTVTLFPDGAANWAQHSTAALYGIKGAA